MKFTVEQQKDAFLTLAKSGLYINYGPEKLLETYKELTEFLKVRGESIDEIDLCNLYELQFYLALMTNEDVTAKICLTRLCDRFLPEKSQRIKLMQSIYLESTENDETAKKKLGGNNDETRLMRRLTTFSRKKNENKDYIDSLIRYIDLQPSNLQTWAELADEYAKIKQFDKSIYCWKEVLLQVPLAYNIFYKVGLMYYYYFLEEVSFKLEKKEKVLGLMDILVNARNNFLRSVEICDSYSKSWLGAYVVCENEFKKTISRILKNEKHAKNYLSDCEKILKLSRRKFMENEDINDDQFMKLIDRHNLQ